MIVVAHGSKDPRFAQVVEAVVARVRALAPGVDVSIGYLEHGPPNVADIAGAVAVPLLLSAGYHVHVDLPQQAPSVTVTPAVGPDERLAVALADRLREAGYDGTTPVTLAAAGSADERSRRDVEVAADQLSAHLGVTVGVAYVASGQPRLADVHARIVASYLLAPGAFADAVAACGAQVIAAPIGAHPLLAEIVLDRYKRVVGQPPGRTAPA